MSIMCASVLEVFYRTFSCPAEQVTFPPFAKGAKDWAPKSSYLWANIDDMSDPQTPLADAQDAFDIALDEIYNTTPEILDLVKIRISFWDKLALLNAGTLALSFSASASFRGHSAGDGGVGYLFAAWKLMILAIILSLVAQWAATGSATYLRRQLLALKTHRRLIRIQQNLTKNAIQLGEPHHSLLNETEREVDKAKSYARPFELVAHIAGALAQVATILGFYWLYRFAHTNLYHS
jgi:hypothetical protein